MPRRTVLSKSQKQRFEKLPTAAEELAGFFTLTKEEIEFIKNRRRQHNKIGFAVQLSLMKYPGRTLRPNESIPSEILNFISEQIDVDSDEFKYYGRREETIREHTSLISKWLGYEAFQIKDYKRVFKWLVPLAMENADSCFLVGAILNELRHKKILSPPLAVIERLVAMSETLAEQKIYSRITDALSRTSASLLESWLILQDGKKQSVFSWIRQPIGCPNPGNIIEVINRINLIKSLNIPEEVEAELSENRRHRLIQEGKQITVHNLRLFQSSRKYSIMVIFLADFQRVLVDEAISMHDRIIGRLLRRSKNRCSETLQENSQNIKKTMGALALLGRTLIDAKESGLNSWESIDQIVDWEELYPLIEEAENLSSPTKLNTLSFIDSYYAQIRRYTPALLENFDFRAAKGAKEILSAIELLKEMNDSGKRKITDIVPTSFVNNQWAAFVFENGQINRHYYELCVLSELRNSLRSGDIWVTGSLNYQDFERYLLSKSLFNELAQNHDLPLSIAVNYDEYIESRLNLLNASFDEANSCFKNKSSEDVLIKNGRLSIKPYQGNTIPDEAKSIIREIYNELPKIKITDLLVEVDSWTGFTDQFTHLRTGLTADNKEHLLTVILADAINLGLTRMAEACPDTSYKNLSWTSDWFVSEESYTKSLADLVNFHHQMELVSSWGDGTTSSSDGQHFPLGSIAKPLGGLNPKYGNRSGLLFYTHISDQYSPFHTQVINSNVRDATYMLDGLLYHKSDLNITEHFTDTAGFTDHVFGLCHLLGFKFSPRIRSIGDLSLFPIEKKNEWKHLGPLFGEKIKLKEIKNQWDEILRLASSIRMGTVTASSMIKKLASYPRQNRLAQGLREIGRIERTIFILNWIKDPGLRKRVQAGLNKGESRNALARAVFFNRCGEIRDRSFENQCYRASGLNLVVTTIIIWNTFYLEKAVENLRKKKHIPDEYLAYLSPLGWEHINLTGDYVWNI